MLKLLKNTFAFTCYLSILITCHVYADQKTVEISEHLLGIDSCTETLAKEGNYVFVARRHDGVAVVDVSNPAAPVSLPLIDPDGANSTIDVWDVQVLNGMLYVMNQPEAIDPAYGNWVGMYIFDVAIPNAPTLEGAIVWGGGAWHHQGASLRSGEVAEIAGTPYVFLCSLITGQVEVFDVTNPAAINFVTTIFSPTWDSPYETVYKDGKLYTAWMNGGFTIDDVSNPGNPTRLGHQSYTGPATINGGLKTVAPVLGGDYVVTGEYTLQGEVRLWDTSNPSNITQVATWSHGSGALLWSLRATDDYAYVAHLEDGIQILELPSLTHVGCFDPDPGVPGGVWAGIADIVVEGQRLYASHQTRGLFIVDHDESLPLPDTITITKAIYKKKKKQLIVYATSSDQPNVTLEVLNYGQMTWRANRQRYELKLKPVSTNPGTVTVQSNLGGSATRTVTVR